MSKRSVPEPVVVVDDEPVLSDEEAAAIAASVGEAAADVQLPPEPDGEPSEPEPEPEAEPEAEPEPEGEPEGEVDEGPPPRVDVLSVPHRGENPWLRPDGGPLLFRRGQFDVVQVAVGDPEFPQVLQQIEGVSFAALLFALNDQPVV